MNVDAFFTKGTTHTVCQDYARTGWKEDHPYAIISDGCSAAPDSDFGARLLTQAAESYIFRDTEMGDQAFGHAIIAKADTFASALSLNPTALNATLLIVQSRGPGSVSARIIGDGVMAWKAKDDGRIVIHNVIYPSGAPYYLQYERNPEDKNQYLEQFGGRCDVDRWDAGWEKVTDWHHYEYKSFSTLYIPSISWTLSFKEVHWMALFSDGVTQFMRPEKSTTTKRLEHVPVEEVVAEFTNFKPQDNPNYSGGFVQRRARRVFKDHPEWQNTDDFSMAVIAEGEQ